MSVDEASRLIEVWVNEAGDAGEGGGDEQGFTECKWRLFLTCGWVNVGTGSLTQVSGNGWVPSSNTTVTSIPNAQASLWCEYSSFLITSIAWYCGSVPLLPQSDTLKLCPPSA